MHHFVWQKEPLGAKKEKKFDLLFKDNGEDFRKKSGFLIEKVFTSYWHNRMRQTRSFQSSPNVPPSCQTTGVTFLVRNVW